MMSLQLFIIIKIRTKFQILQIVVIRNMKNQKPQQHKAGELKLKQETSNDKNQNKRQGQSQSVIGHYNEAPSYMKDNQHITHGYRINFDTPVKIFKSLFMIHNESVNIWSHCLPALIICIFVFSFFMIVDHKQFGDDFNYYKDQISKSFSHYTESLQNLTLTSASIQNSSQSNISMTQPHTQTQFQEIKNNIVNSYNQFIGTINQNIENLNKMLDVQVEGLKDSFKQNMKQNINNFQRIKQNYEKVIAPQILSQLNSQVNSFNLSFVAYLKENLETLKNQIDSDSFSYIDVFHHSPNPQHIPRWPIIVFLLSAAFCLLCSTFFHLFYPMSSKSYAIFSRFDYAGISLLIAGSTFPPFYYSMYCYLQVALVYEIIEMTFAISLFILSIFQWMHRPQHAHFKAILYGGFGLFNVIPLSHLLINDIFFDNFGDTYEFAPSLPYYLLLGASYLFGLYVYTVRCPERHYPGKFNVCGHSHQIWHMFVVLGVIFTYFGALQNFQMRKNNVCPSLQS